MKQYAGLDLSLESTQVCIVDEDGRKLVSQRVESSPEAIAGMLERHGPIERDVIESRRMSPAICLGLRELGVSVVCIDARQAHQSLKGDCQDFRVWAGIMGNKESHYVTTQRACHTE